MPELPEVETVCRALAPLVTGQTFAAAHVHWHRTVEPLDPAQFEEMLPGKSIQNVSRRAKLIVFRLSGELVVTIHLRMTGILRFVGADDDEPPANTSHLRVEFDFESGDALRFFDARKFGRIKLFTVTEWQRYQAEAYGPEPLDPAFDGTRFAEMLRVRRRQIKPLLLDQTFIAGIGNIYADEALFRARIHPLQEAAAISRRKATILHHAIVDVLERSIQNRGTTLRDYRSALGESGDNQRELLVYGAAPGTPCPRCGTGLRRMIVGQRGTTFCPRCQRLRHPRVEN